jgi:sulfur carrier protein
MTSVPYLGAIVAIPKVYLYTKFKRNGTKINNQTKHFAAESLTVQALLDLKFPKKQNGYQQYRHSKIQLNSHPIQETDTILIISATQGG